MICRKLVVLMLLFFIAIVSISCQETIKSYSSVDEYFQVSVSSKNPYIGTNNNDTVKYYYNYSHFKMPQSTEDKPLKLVAFFLGGAPRNIGANFDLAYDYMNMGKVFNKLGYAYLTIAGLPEEFCKDKKISDGGAYCMNWMCIEAFKKSYEYVVEKYNIDKNGVFIYGESQGGSAAENIAELSGVPVLATILDAPSISAQWTQVFKVGKRNKTVQAVLGALYNIRDMESYKLNKANIGVLDPFNRGMDSPIDIFKSEKDVTGLITEFKNGMTVENITSRKERMVSSPLLMLIGLNDNILSSDVMLAYGRACQNNGSNVRLFLYGSSLMQGNSYYSAGSHGVVQFSNDYATIDGIIITRGFYDVLRFMFDCGGERIDEISLLSN